MEKKNDHPSWKIPIPRHLALSRWTTFLKKPRSRCSSSYSKPHIHDFTLFSVSFSSNGNESQSAIVSEARLGASDFLVEWGISTSRSPGWLAFLTLKRLWDSKQRIRQNLPTLITCHSNVEAWMSNFHRTAGSCRHMWVASLWPSKASAKRRSANLNSYSHCFVQTTSTKSHLLLLFAKAKWDKLQSDLSLKFRNTPILLCSCTQTPLTSMTIQHRRAIAWL